MNESRLVYDIMRKLGLYGAVFRCNSGSIPLPNGKRFNAMPKGFSDIMLIRPDGVACFVECKTDKGKLSDEQARFIPYASLKRKSRCGTLCFGGVGDMRLKASLTRVYTRCIPLYIAGNNSYKCCVVSSGTYSKISPG